MGVLMEDNELLTITQAASLANRSVAVIRRAAALGSLKALKVGSVWMVRRQDLDAWISDPAKHKRGPKSK